RAVAEHAGDDALLALAEVGFTVIGEDLLDGLAVGQFDLVIGVGEGNTQAVREATANRRFAATHETDEHERALAETERIADSTSARAARWLRATHFAGSAFADIGLSGLRLAVHPACYEQISSVPLSL